MDETTPQPEPLQAVRERIDAIDRQLRALLNQRAACAQDVARIKAASQLDEPPVYYRPEREAQILARLREEKRRAAFRRPTSNGCSEKSSPAAYAWNSR